MNEPKCRFCKAPLNTLFVDLGMSPLSNTYLRQEELRVKENFYPLHAYVCDNCFLVQLEEFEAPERIFSNYAYFSSYSESWLVHSKKFVEMIVRKLQLDTTSFVVELASNDGYLLQHFKSRNIPVLGIEPAANVAQAARVKGIDTMVEFFGNDIAQRLISQGKQADLIIGNNVLAHVPDLNDFLSGVKFLLRPNGLITMEFPHLLQLIKQNQFDTIYHEHFSYFSLTTVIPIFKYHGLTIFDVEELNTHGGSLRIYAGHQDGNITHPSARIVNLLKKEEEFGLKNLRTYQVYSEKVKKTKWDLLTFLLSVKKQGKVVAGYGAPAKGNTLLNYCGIRTDFLDYTVDRSPYKQGYYLPGTHIPIEAPEKIAETQPDYVLILPWNLKQEIMEQISFIRRWGGEFVIPIPKLMVV